MNRRNRSSISLLRILEIKTRNVSKRGTVNGVPGCYMPAAGSFEREA